MEPVALPPCFADSEHTESAAHAWRIIPPHLHAGFARYFNDRIVPGSFLRAVLCNDFRDALVTAAPDITLMHLQAIALLLVNAPRRSWGSTANVLEWTGERNAEG